MATNPYGGSGGFASHPKSKPAKKPEKHSLLGNIVRGPVDLTGNLVGDLKDAVVGLPAGMVMLARDPIKTSKQMVGASWQTWSPLFHGDFMKFGKGVYDHPLAPLLDVATVFSLGMGGVARGASATVSAGRAAEIAKGAAPVGRTEKVASLRMPKKLDLADPTGKGRSTQTKFLSERPGRRAVQEMILGAEPHLPKWFSGTIDKGRYEHAFAQDMAGRLAAKNLMVIGMLKAGKALTDPDTAPIARQEMAAHGYTNLLRHHNIHDESEADRLVSTGHYTYVQDVRLIDKTAGRMLKRAWKHNAKWQRVRDSNAELTHALPKIREELATANEKLAEMHKNGWQIHHPAGKSKRPSGTQRMEQEARYVLEQERIVADLEARLTKAHDASALHTKALDEIEMSNQWRVGWEDRSFKQFFAHVSHSDDAFTDFTTNFGKRVTTPLKERAARSADGGIYVVPKHDARNLGHEAANSASFLKYAYTKSTHLWKTMQLGYTTRTITNNGIGNWFMYAFRDGGSPESFQAFIDGVKHTKGPAAAAEVLQAATPYKRNTWLYRHFGTELGNTFGSEMHMMDGGAGKRRMLAQGVYPLVHRFADEPIRVAAITKYLRSSSEVKAIMKEKGVSFDKAARRALRENPDLQKRASNHARATSGDYHTMHKWEHTVRDLVPFYLWDRHVVRTGYNMLLEQPGRLVLAQKLSNLGVEETERVLGAVPDFMRGAVPLEILGLAGGSGGHKNVALTSSLNPFATLGDLAEAAQGLTTGGGIRSGAAVLQQANPILTGLVEGAMGTSALTGAPTPAHGGIVTTMLKNVVEGLPLVTTPFKLVGDKGNLTPKGEPYMFARDNRSPISSFLGIPLRSYSTETGGKVAEIERPTGKKKKATHDSNPYT